MLRLLTKKGNMEHSDYVAIQGTETARLLHAPRIKEGLERKYPRTRQHSPSSSGSPRSFRQARGPPTDSPNAAITTSITGIFACQRGEARN